VIEVRVLREDDWQLWRRLRQAALAEAPQAYGSTLADWTGAGDTEERWRARLAAVPLNLVLFSADQPVGMISATAEADSAVVEIISLWVAPAARGQGVGDLAVREALAWAASAHPERPVVLAVRHDNLAARALYARQGFVAIGPSPEDPQEQVWRHEPGRI
jgi:ribosomal protein S18 acetylase RimI-like enzyme